MITFCIYYIITDYESSGRKRGRPKKATTLTLNQEDKKPIGQFFFHLIRETDGWGLHLKDSKGNACEPDYHRYTGMIRNALREFFLLHQKEQKYLRWDAFVLAEDGFIVHEPGPRLMELALRSRLLLDEKKRVLKASNEETRVLLALDSPEQQWVEANPKIITSEQTVQKKQDAEIYPISSEHVVLGTQVFHCEDLGPYWNEWSILHAGMKASDLQTYLSLALSEFPMLKLAYEGYTVKTDHPINASSSLFSRKSMPMGICISSLRFIWNPTLLDFLRIRTSSRLFILRKQRSLSVSVRKFILKTQQKTSGSCSQK